MTNLEMSVSSAEWQTIINKCITPSVDELKEQLCAHGLSIERTEYLRGGIAQLTQLISLRKNVASRYYETADSPFVSQGDDDDE